MNDETPSAALAAEQGLAVEKGGIRSFFLEHWECNIAQCREEDTVLNARPRGIDPALRWPRPVYRSAG